MPLFPVTTFKRVFDTEVKQEVLTLRELTRALRRFEIKTTTAANTKREYAQIDLALADARKGIARGKHGAEMLHALDKSEKDPRATEQRLLAKAAELRERRDKDVKQDLRLWSPTLYQGHERGREGVTHVSCLVLDYDSGVKFSDVQSLYADYYFIMHTTWSHTLDHPRYRIILPLAGCIKRENWNLFWEWVWERSDREIDLRLKSAAANFALPAIGSIDALHEAYTNAGPLLDPRTLGMSIDESLELMPKHLSDSMMLGSADKTYVEYPHNDVVVYDDDTDADEPSAPVVDIKTETKKEKGPPRKTLLVDFDGVIHAYRSGWTGITSIPDPPVPGAIEWLSAMTEIYSIAIFSARAKQTVGVQAMKEWLLHFGLPEKVLKKIKFPKQKIPAHLYIDDRAWRFEGIFPSPDKIDALVPWNRS